MTMHDVYELAQKHVLAVIREDEEKVSRPRLLTSLMLKCPAHSHRCWCRVIAFL